MYTTFDAGNGRTLSYLRRGEGPQVVCVPGGPGMDPDAYFAAMDLPGHELIILAPRGTGASSPPATPEGYRLAGYTEDLEALRRHLDAPALTIYGNSHGGMVALGYACRAPERVARLILTNAPARMDDAYRQAAQEVAARFTARVADGAQRLTDATAADAVLDRTDVGEDERRRAYRTLMARYVVEQGPAQSAYLDRLCAAPMNWDAVGVMYEEILGGLDALEGAERVPAPALVIAGELDVTVPATEMRRIADGLPHGRYLEFPWVGHFPEVEAGGQFSAAVTGFLADTD